MDTDERYQWIAGKIILSLKPKSDEVKMILSKEQNRLAVNHFLNSNKVAELFVGFDLAKCLFAAETPPHTFVGKLLVFVKQPPNSVPTLESIENNVMIVETTSSILGHSNFLVDNAFLPLFCAEFRSTKEQNTAMGDRLFEQFLKLSSAIQVTEGTVQNKAVLAKPNTDLLKAWQLDAGPTRPGFIHILESIVVSWNKHVKGVLSFNVVKAVSQLYKHPTISDELATVQHHSRDIDRVLDHFASEPVLEVFEMLANAGSHYAVCRKQIVDELQISASETAEILILLTTLEQCCKSLRGFLAQMDVSQICKNIPPLVHTVLLIWQTSVYYHKTKQFWSLLRETANFIVQIAQAFVGAETKDVINNPEKSHDMLRDALRICASFRGAYLDWKAKADVLNEQRRLENAQKLTHQPKDDNLFNTKLFGQFEFRASNPKGLQYRTEIEPLAQYSPWPARNAPCFDHLNAFMERCNDLLELVQTTDHFRKLSDLADLGGTGSASLDALVADVYTAYVSATKEFFASVPNVLDIDCSRPFERSFYKLRLIVMELEDKLVAIMRAGYRQTTTLSSRLCFTEIFGNVSSRKRIRDALIDEFNAIVDGLKEEIASTRKTFQMGTKGQGEIPYQRNVPSFVSTLRWAEALRARLTGVFELTQRVCPFIFEDEEGWHIRDVYKEVIGDITKFIPDPSKHWTDQVIESLVEHLKKPVYVQRDTLIDTLDNPDKSVLSINISPEQSVLLRELVCISKWFTEDSDYQLPIVAGSVDWQRIFSAATRLHVISGTYNAIFSSTNELEMQLFSDSFYSAHQLVNEGCTTVCWNMERLNDYIISLSTNLSSDLWKRVLTVRTCFDEIHETTKMSDGLPLTVFAPGIEEVESLGWEDSRMVTMEAQSDKLQVNARDVLYPLGQRILSIVETIFSCVQISRVSPAWIGCTEHVNQIILDSLLELCIYNFQCLIDNFFACGAFGLIDESQRPSSGELPSPEDLQRPFLTIELMLTQNAVMFVPPLDKSLNKMCLSETLNEWLEACFTSSRHISFIASNSDDDRNFDVLLRNSQVLGEMQTYIWSVIDVSVSTCKQVMPIFENYVKLWEQDSAKVFEEFLDSAKSGKVRKASHAAKNDSHPITPAGGHRQVGDEETTISREMTAASETKTAASLTRFAHKGGQAASNVIGPGLPTLDDFDSEMNYYKLMVDELEGMPDFHDCGFIRLDIRPIRDSLIVLASKSIYVYARFLIDHTVTFVDQLREFLDEVEAKIDLLNENDFKSYKTLMNLVNQVQKKQAEVESKIPVLQRAVGMIQKYGHALPGNYQSLFSTSPSRWNAVKTKVSLAKQRLAPKIQLHLAKVINELKDFDQFLVNLWEEIECANLYSEDEDVSFEQAFDQIEAFNQRIRDIEDTAQDLKELQNFVEASVVDFDIITKAKKRLSVLECVWQCVHVFSNNYQDWCSQQWVRMNYGKLRNDVAGEIKKLQSLPPEAREWPLVKSAEATAKVVEEYVPLLESVSNQAMRARHWKQLLRAINSAVFMDSDSIRTSTFGQMLDLGLNNNTNDVYHIVQRAVKDLKIEKSLKYLEEIWFGKLFELKSRIIRKPSRGDGADGRRQRTATAGGTDSARLTGGMTIDIAIDDGRSDGAETKLGGYTSASTVQASALNSGKPTEDQVVAGGPMAISIITRFEVLYEEIESHQLQLQTIMNDPLASSFVDEVTKWQQNLQHVESVLHQWQRVQEMFISMQEVFAIDEVRVQYPQESHKFSVVSKDFIGHMRHVEKNPNIFQNCNRANMLDRLESMGDILTSFVKSLMQYIDRTQIEFPRLCLLAPLDSLQIVSSSLNPDLLTGCIFKFLPSAQTLILSEDRQSIIGLTGHLGDQLRFLSPIFCQQSTQVFNALFEHTKQALKHQLPLALKTLDENSTIGDGILGLPAEMVLTAMRIKLTKLLEGEPSKLANLKEAIDDLVNASCAMLKSTSLEDTIESTRLMDADPNPIMYMLLPVEIVKIQAVISLLIVYREMLFSDGSQLPTNSFEYAAIPKVMFDQEKSNISFSAVGETIDYGFEFVGASSFQHSIVLMPPFIFASVFKSIATRKQPVCFLNDDGVLISNYVETFFSLFGHMIYAYKCGSGTNLASDAAHTPGRITEITQAAVDSAAWVHFSEFHCLSPDLQLLAAASINEKATDEETAHGTIFFTADSTVCIGNGLPSRLSPICDAVRDRLRVTSLTKPDILVRTETNLVQLGFTSAFATAKLLVNFMKCSSRLLSADITTHNRLGKRVLDVDVSTLTSTCILDAICKCAGEKLSQLKLEQESDFLSSNETQLEGLAVVTAIEAIVLGQFERESSELIVALAPLFFHLSSGEYVKSANKRTSSRMIPTKKSARPVNARALTNSLGNTVEQFFSRLDLKLPEINAAVIKDQIACTDFHEALFSAARRLQYNIELTNTLIEKLDQLHEMFYNYPFITIIGPACSGKTEAIKLFCAGMKQMGTTLNIHSIYPASVESSRVFGDSKKLGRYEFGSHSGLIPSAFEMLHSMNTPEMSHVIEIDGVLAPFLVEKMQDAIYSDDINMMVDGRRLNIARQNCHVFWETDSLANLSPSSISRMALISICRETSAVPLTLYYWIQRKPVDFQRLFFDLFGNVFIPALNKRAELCYANCWPISNDLQIQMAVMSFTKVLDDLYHAMDIRKEGIFKKSCYFALYWAFGGSLKFETRAEFFNWMVTAYADCPKDLDWLIPDAEKAELVKVEASQISNLPVGVGISPESFIRTLRTEQLSYFVSLICDMGSPIAIIGGDGCGKTRTLSVKLDAMTSSQLSDFDSTTVSCSLETDSVSVFSALDRHVAWRHGQTYAPRSKRLVCFIDDLHAAKVEFDTALQTSAELIRQHIDDGGFNSPADCSWRYIKATSYIVSLNPVPKNATACVTERLLWKFFMFSLASPDRSEQFHIFGGLVQAHFSPCSNDLKTIINDLISLSLDLVCDLSKIFVPTLPRSHYMFSMHDLYRMFAFFCQSMNTELAQQNIANLFYLWRHELDWALREKLNSSVDQQKYEELYGSRVKKYITDKRYLEWLFEPETPLFSSIITHENGMTNVAVPNMGQTTSGHRRYVLYDFYKHEKSMDEDVFALSGEAQNEWNKNYPNVEIFFYREVLSVLSRLARTVASSVPIGNVVIVAEGYPGRAQFFATLGGSVAGLQIRTLPPPVPGASPQEKTNEAVGALAENFFEAGCKEQKMLIIIRDEEFFECPTLLTKLCDFITSSDLTSLFSLDTQTSIINAVRADATSVGLAHSKHAIWRFFERRVYENTRVCIIFNRVDSPFWMAVREYPAIFKTCSIFWLNHWSRGKLVEHADYHFRTEVDEDDEDAGEEPPDEWEWLSETDRENVCHLLADMHLTIRTQAASLAKNSSLLSGPFGNLSNTTFEYFARRFCTLVLEERGRILAEDEAAKQVIERLRHDSDAATQLAHQLEIDLQIAEDKRDGAAQLLKQIGQDKAIMELQQRTVKGHMRKLTYYRSQVPKYQMACERTQYKATQIVDDTKGLLKALDMNILSELRSIQKPKEGMDDLMAGIIIVLKSPTADLSWQRGAKRQLANLERFIDELSSFKSIELNENTIKILESQMRRINENREGLVGDARTGPLLRWLENMIHYQKLMVQRVAPLQRKLDETKASVLEGETKLAALNEKRGAFDNRLFELSKGFEEATVDKQEQEKKVSEMRGRLEDARGLRRLLDAEMARCKQITNSLQKRLSLTMFGRCALAAGAVAYLGPFQPKFRHEMLLYHWPVCVKKRGLPLIFDRVDDVRGCVVDASINGVGLDEDAEDVDETGFFGGDVNTDLFRPISNHRNSITPADLVEPPLISQEEVFDNDQERARRYLDALLCFLVGKKRFLDMQRLGYHRQRMENVAIMTFSANRPICTFSDWSKSDGDVDVSDLKFATEIDKMKTLELQPKPEVVPQLERHVIDGDVVLVKNAPRTLDHLLLPLIQHHFVTINLREITILPVGKRKVICGGSFEAFFSSTPVLPGEFERTNADGAPAFSPQVASMTSLISYRLDEDVIRDALILRSMARLRPSINSTLNSLYDTKATLYGHADEIAEAYKNLMERSDVSVFSSSPQGSGSTDEASANLSFSQLLNARYRIRTRVNALNTLIKKMRLLGENCLGPTCGRAATMLHILNRLQSNFSTTCPKSFDWIGLDHEWLQLALPDSDGSNDNNEQAGDEKTEPANEGRTSPAAEEAAPPPTDQTPEDGQQQEPPPVETGENKGEGLESDKKIIEADVGDGEVKMIVDKESKDNEKEPAQALPVVVKSKLESKQSVSSGRSQKVSLILPEIPIIGDEIWEPYSSGEIAELESLGIKKPLELISAELQPPERSMLITAFALNTDKSDSTFLIGGTVAVDQVAKPEFVTSTDWARLNSLFTAGFLRAMVADSEGWTKWLSPYNAEQSEDFDITLTVSDRQLTNLEKAYIIGILKPQVFTSFCQKICSEASTSLMPSSEAVETDQLGPRTVVLCPARHSHDVLSILQTKFGNAGVTVIDSMNRTFVENLKTNLSSETTNTVFIANIQVVPQSVLNLVFERHSLAAFKLVVTVDPADSKGNKALVDNCVDVSEPWAIVSYDAFLNRPQLKPPASLAETTFASKLKNQLERTPPEFQSGEEMFKFTLFLNLVQTVSVAFLETEYPFENSTIPRAFENYLRSFLPQTPLPTNIQQFSEILLKSTTVYSSILEPRLAEWIMQKALEVVNRFSNALTSTDVVSKLADSDFADIDEFLQENRRVVGRRYFVKLVNLLDIDDWYWYDDPPTTQTSRLWKGLVVAYDHVHTIRHKKARQAYQLAQESGSSLDLWQAFMKSEAIQLCGLLDTVTADLGKLASCVLLDRFAIAPELHDTAAALCLRLTPSSWIREGDVDLLFCRNGVPLAWYLSQVVEKRFEFFQSFAKLKEPGPARGRLVSTASGLLPNLTALLHIFKVYRAFGPNTNNESVCLPVEAELIDTQVGWLAKPFRFETKAGSKMATFSEEIDEPLEDHGPLGIIVKDLNFSVLLPDPMGASTTRKFICIPAVQLETMSNLPEDEKAIKIPMFSSTNAALTPVDFLFQIDANLDKAVRTAAGLDPTTSLPGSCQIEAVYFALLSDSKLGDYPANMGFSRRSTETSSRGTKTSKLERTGSGTDSPNLVSSLAFAEQDTGVISLLEAIISEAVTTGDDELSSEPPTQRSIPPTVKTSGEGDQEKAEEPRASSRRDGEGTVEGSARVGTTSSRASTDTRIPLTPSGSKAIGARASSVLTGRFNTTGPSVYNTTRYRRPPTEYLENQNKTTQNQNQQK